MTHNGQTTNYTYDAGNKLLQAGNTTFTYDGNGNMVSKTENGQTTTYIYNYEDKMVQVVLPGGGTVNYAYDHEGKRTGKTAGGTTIDYYFDGDAVIIEAQGASIMAYYTQGQGLISQKRGNASYFYHYDGLGSTKALTDANQNVQASYVYDAWGNVLQSSGTVVNPYLYVGEFGYSFDDTISLTVVGERFLNTSHGVFLTRDPARLSLLGNSLYRYTDASPINYIDPTGRSTCWIGYAYFKKYCLWYNRKTGKLDKITQGEVRHHKDQCVESKCVPKFCLFLSTYKGTSFYDDGIWMLPTFPGFPGFNMPPLVPIPYLLDPPEGTSSGYDPKKWRLSCKVELELTVKFFWCCKEKKKIGEEQ